MTSETSATLHGPTVLRGSVRIPTSKPHTQRALLLAALADGESTIIRPNVCSESVLLKAAVTALGARITEQDERIVVNGVAGAPRSPNSILRVAGSGFALRHLLPITALAPAPCVIAGDRQLGTRPVLPLLTALGPLGCRVESAEAGLVLPMVTWSTGLGGGEVEISARETSQFVSSLMLPAPYAAGPLTIRVPGPIVSQHYIRMTAEMMTRFGASVRVREDLREIKVRPGGYRAQEVVIGPDVTSLFYFVAAAVVLDTDILLEDVTLGTDAFLDEAVGLGRQLGVRIAQAGTALRITSGPAPAARVEIDAADVPTLVPALAAAASSLPHGMLLRGAGHVRYHKTSRLQVVLEELTRMGRVLRPVYRDGHLDGFGTEGTAAGTADRVDARGDHRNFMALALAAMDSERPVEILGAHTLTTSFADFLDCFRALAATPVHA